MRFILIAVFCLGLSPAHGQASLHWQAWHAIRRDATPTVKNPPVSIRYRAHHRGRR